MYQSKARVYIAQNGPKLVGADVASVMTATNNYLWTQCELICSPRILEAVAARPDIAELPSFQGDASGSPGESVAASLSAANIVGYLRENVSAIPGKRDDIISIFVKSPNKDDAAAIANAIVDEYTHFHLTANKNTAAETFKLLRDAKKTTDDELQKMYAARKDYQQTHPHFTLGQDRGNAVLDRYNQLSSARTAAQLDVLRTDSMYNTTKAMTTDPEKIRQLMNAPDFRQGDNQQLRGKLRDLEEQFATLSTVYLQGSASLNAAENQISRMQKELDEEDRRDAEAYLAELATRRDAAKQQESTITDMLHEQEKEVLQLNNAAAEFDNIESEVRRLEHDSQSLSDQMKDINMAMNVDRPMNITVVENAEASAIPLEPDKASIGFYSILIGGMVGVGLAFLREFTDLRLRSADEIKLALGMPILGLVPHIQHARTPSQRGTQLHSDPMSDVAEAYRTIRTAIYFGNPNGVAKTLLITSPCAWRWKDDAGQQSRHRHGASGESDPSARRRFPKADAAQDF